MPDYFRTYLLQAKWLLRLAGRRVPRSAGVDRRHSQAAELKRRTLSNIHDTRAGGDCVKRSSLGSCWGGNVPWVAPPEEMGDEQ
jgi:hypothetical protein